MNVPLIIGGAVGALPCLWVISVVSVACYAYGAMFRPRTESSEESREYCLAQGDFDPSFLALAWESVRVVSPRGYDLAVFALPALPALSADAAAAGSLSPGEPPPAGTALFVHGFTTTHFSMMKYARPFAERGWNVVALDLAGHGDSAVPRSRSKAPSFGFYEKEDLGAVVEWIRLRFPGSRPVVLVGESMGAATVLQYAPLGAPAPAAGGDGAPGRRLIDAVVADCPFSSAAEELAVRLASAGVPRILRAAVAFLVSAAVALIRGFRPEEASPMESVMASPVPILFIHGGDDRYVPTGMSIRMAEERRRRDAGPTEVLIIDGARHAKSVVVEPAAWFSKVFAFIDKYARNRTGG